MNKIFYILILFFSTISTDTKSNVDFSWQASTNTNSYDLQVTNINTSTSINKTGLTTTNATVELDKGQPYSWKVISKNTATTQTGTSSSWKFYLAGQGIKNYAPFPDGKQSPASDLTNISEKTVDVALDAGTLYYWRVKTSDGTNSSFSTVYSFRTE